jgi:hypothetical protein
LDKGKNWILGKCPFPQRDEETRRIKNCSVREDPCVTSESGIKKTGRDIKEIRRWKAVETIAELPPESCFKKIREIGRC